MKIGCRSKQRALAKPKLWAGYKNTPVESKSLEHQEYQICQSFTAIESFMPLWLRGSKEQENS